MYIYVIYIIYTYTHVHTCMCFIYTQIYIVCAYLYSSYIHVCFICMKIYSICIFACVHIYTHGCMYIHLHTHACLCHWKLQALRFLLWSSDVFLYLTMHTYKDTLCWCVLMASFLLCPPFTFLQRMHRDSGASFSGKVVTLSGWELHPMASVPP